MKPSVLTPLLALVPAIALTACPPPAPDDDPPAVPVTPDTPREPAPPEQRMTVTVYFTRGEEPVPVQREVPQTDAVLRASLEALLVGPSAAEVERGISSWFSAATAGMLQQVRLEDGHAVVDFTDFSRVIPGASTSAGSAILLGELNSTVFEVDGVDSVEYRFDGSCEAFWNWLQYDCQIVHRTNEHRHGT